MFLKQIKLSNFKNYSDADVTFCHNVNCLVGNNGVGKTNLLDAIYYLSFSKSYFNSIDSQNIRQGEEFFAIHGNYIMDNEEENMVSCIVKQGKGKQMKFNRKAYQTFAEHIGRIPLVIVSPTDQSLITGGSEVRRKFLDGVISQTNKSYLQDLLQYTKVVEQRNQLLKRFYEDRYYDEESIAIWDDQMLRFGEKIHQQRKLFLEEFIPLFENYYNWISASSEPSEIRYQSQLEDSENTFEQLLKINRRKDAQVQYSTVGVHKDDLELSISRMPVKKFGSQGQQKTFALALRLAQFEYIFLKCGTKPILLLDDIFDKLDMVRVKQLMQLVGSDRFGQVFVTDTQPGRVEAIFEETPNIEHLIFHVEEGICKLSSNQ